MTNQTEHHAEATLAEVRAIMDEKPFAGGTTLDLVRHWMMSDDHPVNDWERDFAAAIDAHRIEDARSNDTEHHAEAILRDAVPMAWQSRRMYADAFDWHGKIYQWKACSAQEATGHFDRTPGYEYRPLYPASAILDAVREAMAQEWLPIESAPKDGTRILAVASRRGWEKHGSSIVVCAWHGMRWAIMGAIADATYPDTKDECSPSHWMPLPAAPTPQDTPQ